eukprot:scaffold5356_cov116-Skeletonema_marinoi.AAC.2
MSSGPLLKYHRLAVRYCTKCKLVAESSPVIRHDRQGREEEGHTGVAVEAGANDHASSVGISKDAQVEYTRYKWLFGPTPIIWCWCELLWVLLTFTGRNIAKNPISNYSLHGHHYTHAFCTIARQQQQSNSSDGIGKDPFILKRISNEFLFRALSVPIGEKNASASNDGDIIQFASGLDVHGSDIDGKLVLSMLQKMLVEVEVEPWQEVADLMRKIKSEE